MFFLVLKSYRYKTLEWWCWNEKAKTKRWKRSENWKKTLIMHEFRTKKRTRIYISLYTLHDKTLTINCLWWFVLKTTVILLKEWWKWREWIRLRAPSAPGCQKRFPNVREELLTRFFLVKKPSKRGNFKNRGFLVFFPYFDHNEPW